MALVAQAFPARLGLAFRAKCTKELACSGLVEPGISRPILHTLVPIAAINQGAVRRRTAHHLATANFRDWEQAAMCPLRENKEPEGGPGRPLDRWGRKSSATTPTSTTSLLENRGGRPLDFLYIFPMSAPRYRVLAFREVGNFFRPLSLADRTAPALFTEAGEILEHESSHS